MQYYINPMWFYWLRLFDAIDNVCLLLVRGVGALAVVLLAVYIIFNCFFDDELFSVEERKRSKRHLKKLWILFLLCSICYSLIPDEKTIIEMMIARQLDPQNVETGVEAIKNAADCVIQAIQNAK